MPSMRKRTSRVHLALPDSLHGKVRRIVPVMTLLLAVDDAKTAGAIRRELTRSGFPVEVAVAADGVSAREAMRTGEFDLFVLDWMLPGTEGA